jgi:hypothetical protein
MFRIYAGRSSPGPSPVPEAEKLNKTPKNVRSQSHSPPPKRGRCNHCLGGREGRGTLLLAASIATSTSAMGLAIVARRPVAVDGPRHRPLLQHVVAGMLYQRRPLAHVAGPHPRIELLAFKGAAEAVRMMSDCRCRLFIVLESTDLGTRRERERGYRFVSQRSLCRRARSGIRKTF